MKYFTALLFFSSFLIGSLIFTQTAFAAVIPPSQYVFDPNDSLTACQSSCEGEPAFNACNNGPSNTNNGGCGLPACEQGNSWTKYKVECKQTSYDPDTGEEDCSYALVQFGIVCATGDKCDDGGGGILPGYLRAGLCECGIGGTNKICCSGGQMANQCEQIAVDSHNPLWEGTCPWPYRPVSCGQAGEPPCNASACGSVSTPTPPPSTPTPPPSNYCEDDGYTPCTPGEATGGSCINSSGQTCTAYSVYTCNFGGQNYCDPDNINCGAPCTAPPPQPTPTPVTDGQNPVCNSLNLSASSVKQGDPVTITTNTSDDTQVSYVDLFYSGAKFHTQTNNLNLKPNFGFSYGWNTSNIPPNTYTITAIATDTSNKKSSVTAACSASLRIDPPPSWIPASCTPSKQFFGCKMEGKPDCDDYGNPSYPNYSDTAQNNCQTTCAYPTSAQRSSYFCNIPNGTITTPPSVQKVNNVWPSINISTTSNNTITGTDVAIFNGNCSPSCSPTTPGWTFITSCATSNDTPRSCSYTLPASQQPGIRTFALFTKNHNTILNTSNTNFEGVCEEGAERIINNNCSGVASPSNVCTL